MDSILLDWLSRASNEFYGEDNWSAREMIVWVGCKVFDLQESSATFEDIIQTLNIHFSGTFLKTTEASDLEMLAIEALLIFAVSESCELREHFVQIILDLDKDAQIALMGLIKSNMKQHTSLPVETMINEQSSSESDINCEYSSGLPTIECKSGSSSQLGSLQPTQCGVCNHCVYKDAKIDELTNEVASLNQKYGELESQMKSELSKESNKLIDAELMVIENDKHILRLEQENRDALKRISDLEKKILENVELRNKIEALQDEVDVLKPAAVKLDAAEGQLTKLRERLDELQSVKQQLKTESEMHTETYNKLIEAEKELDTLRKCRNQVEDYRMKNVELNILCDEQTTRLQEQSQILKDIQNKNDSLLGSQAAQSLQNKFLVNELQATHELVRVSDRLGGIGEGICELNPVLMQELNKLRADNETLRVKIDATSLDALNALESKLEDEKCLNGSLQKKFNATKDSLAVALLQIAQLESEWSQLKQHVTEYKACQDEAWCMNMEDIKSMQESHQQKLFSLGRRSSDGLVLHGIGRRVVTDQLELELESLQNQFSECRNVINANETAIEELNSQVDHLTKELQIENMGRAEDSKAFREAMSAAEGASARQLLEQQEIAEGKILSLQESHEEVMAIENERARNLQGDIEEEKLKRRRVEREKKMLEADIHKYKTQLQSGFAGGQGLDDSESILREMKVMQQELDTAKSELQSLRSSSVGRVAVDHLTATSSAGVADREGSGGLSSMPSRPQRLRTQDQQGKSKAMAVGGGNQGTYINYLEISEMNDKRVEQLTREKRELMTKSLEGNKERTELNQKLLMSEKEVSVLKARVTKVTLEKDRLERKLAKSASDLSEPSGGSLEQVAAVADENGHIVGNVARTTRSLVGTKRVRSEGFL